MKCEVLPIGIGRSMMGGMGNDQPYTPTTDAVRATYATAHGIGAVAEFDRWLEAVRDEAYDRGAFDAAESAEF